MNDDVLPTAKVIIGNKDKEESHKSFRELSKCTSLSVLSLSAMSTTNGTVKKKKYILFKEKNMPLGSYEWNQIKPVIWMVELLSICCNLTSSWGTLDHGETSETSK